ncbi:hypothetical protein [Nocardia sp. NPDC004123]
MAAEYRNSFLTWSPGRADEPYATSVRRRIDRETEEQSDGTDPVRHDRRRPLDARRRQVTVRRILGGGVHQCRREAGFADNATWLLQDRLIALGVDYREADPFAPHIQVHRNLYTGQNPASSVPLAAELLKAF